MNSKREEQSSNLIAIKVRKRVKRYPHCIKINWTIFLLLLVKKDLWKKKGSCLRWKIITIISSGIVFDSYVMFCLGKFGSSGLFETLQSWIHVCTPTGITNTNVCQYVLTKWGLRFYLKIVQIFCNACLYSIHVCQFVRRLFVYQYVTDLCLSVCSWNFLDIMFSTKLKFAV